MHIPSLSAIVRGNDRRLRLPFRLVWHETERRPRSLVRLAVGVVVIFLFASLGSQYRVEPFTGRGPFVGVVNQVVWVLPQAVSIAFGVVLASWLLDRRRITDLGLDLDPGWRREFVGGTALGIGITSSSVGVALLSGSIEIHGTQVTGGPLGWLGLTLGAVVFQLLFVVPEELFVRGYLITNVAEGLDGVPLIPRWFAAVIGIAAASLLFYLTHSGRGQIFGLMAGGVAVFLGVGYVLSGSLSVPIGIHFGFNIAGVVLGTNLQAASVLRLQTTGTITDSLVLPIEMVGARLGASALGVLLLLWWFHTVRGKLRVSPSIVHPTLRWTREDR